MTDLVTISSAAKLFPALVKGYEQYHNHKLDKALEKIVSKGISLDELINSDKRFATFVRFSRAMEICSSREMFETLTNYIVNGVRSRKIDSEPDLFQIALARLGDLTDTEVKILAKMKELNMYGEANNSSGKYETSRQLESELEHILNIEKSVIASLIHGLGKSGFVIVEQGAWANSECTYILTSFAKYLIDLIFLETGL